LSPLCSRTYQIPRGRTPYERACYLQTHGKTRIMPRPVGSLPDIVSRAHQQWLTRRLKWMNAITEITSITIQPLISIIADYYGRYGYGTTPVQLMVTIPTSLSPPTITLSYPSSEFY
jgi:hypothetical protein